MIKSFHVRGARAIAGWSQTELAERAGISLSTVADCEAERGRTSAQTFDSIKKAFEQESIFITAVGVERRNTASYEITGDDWWLQVLDDVYYTLIDQPESEMLFMFADDRASSREVNDRLRKIRNAGIQMRQLVKEENTYLMGPVMEYRWVPSEYFLNNVTLIYGDKVAICAEDNTKAMIFKDQALASSWRNAFEMLWRGVVVSAPTKSTADERF